MRPQPPTVDDLAQVVASAKRLGLHLARLRIPRSKRPRAGDRVRLLGRVGPMSAEGRALDWEATGAISGWWEVDALAEWLAAQRSASE